MEKSNIYITRFGSLAEMGFFKEHLISGITAHGDVENYCLYIAGSLKDKMIPFALARHFKFTELQNTPK